MKNFGSKSEYHKERIIDLLKAYFKHLSECSHISMPEVYRCVVEMPATRFWVSASRAAVVVSRIMRGDKLYDMRPTKREMFFEIHRRAVALQKEFSDRSIRSIIEEVVAQSAPKFYLAPSSARALILKAKKEWHAEITKKLRGL